MNALTLMLMLGISAYASAAVLNSPVALPVRIVGPPADIEDDASSDATCPLNHFISECRCQDEYVCDGSTIIDERVCRAYHDGVHKTPTMAIATCLPSAGYSISVIAKDTSLGTFLDCPDHYTLMTCSKNDKWSYARHTHFQRATNGCAVVHSPNGCVGTKDHCSGHSYTHLSLLCVKSKGEVVRVRGSVGE